MKQTFKIGVCQYADVFYEKSILNGEDFIYGAIYNGETLCASMCRPFDKDYYDFDSKTSVELEFCQSLLRKAYGNQRKSSNRSENTNIYGRRVLLTINPNPFNFEYDEINGKWGYTFKLKPSKVRLHCRR